MTSEQQETSDVEVRLDGKLGIHCARELSERLQSALESGKAVRLDVSDIVHVDTAALQLLVAFVNDLKGQGRTLTWSGVTEMFTEFANLLDLEDILDLSPAGNDDADGLCPVF